MVVHDEVVKALKREIRIAECVDSVCCNGISVYTVKSALELIESQRKEMTVLQNQLDAAIAGQETLQNYITEIKESNN